MKFLVIGHNYYPELTGIGKYTSEFTAYLTNQKKVSVQVITAYPHYPQWKITGKYTGRWFQTEVIAGATVRRIPIYVPSRPTGFKRLIMDMTFLFNAFLVINYLLIVKRIRFDYVFIAVPSFSLGLLGLYYRFFVRTARVLYHIQDLQVDAAYKLNIIKNKTLLGALYRTERFILEKVDFVSTISPGMRKKILSKSARIKTCLLFPNWINNQHIFPLHPTPVLRRTELYGKRIVFYSGAIGEKQGLEVVLEAARHFSGFPNDLAFVIAGEGPFKQRLMKQCEAWGLGNLFFYNLLPVTEFNEMLNASFLHLVIQKESGDDLFLPSKLTNILGTGGCAIVTAEPGTSLYDILYDYGCGYLIKPASSQALIDAINVLMDNASIRKKISACAASYANRFLHQSTVTEEYLASVQAIRRTGERIEPAYSLETK
jgi:colanic acid biosynthesis glycosyl transferase WcaI